MAGRQVPMTRGRLAVRRGATAPAACNRRFVPPAVRRREQDLIDAQKWIGRGIPPDIARALIDLRGSW